jgi:hypothetical protein
MKLHEDKRGFFRLPLESCSLTFSSIARDGSIRSHGQGHVKDVSGSGIAFYSNTNIENSLIDLEFEIDNFTFNIKGQIIRKNDDMFKGYFYACHYIELSSFEQIKLAAVLLRIDTSKKREQMHHLYNHFTN